MHHRRSSSNTSTGSNGYPLFESAPHTPLSSVSSSPPPSSNYNLLTVQPPPAKTANSNTFVHKLYNMVLDDQFQHLIAWSYTGSSFIVCNIMEFSRDVLPKHFKHNNFSSFVRQLNMYGFHKVNKSPRGHRTLAENQIWEFSHQKFLRGRHELLDDIKRKAMETSDQQQRQVNGDIQAHMNMIQSSQSDMMHQLTSLFENFNLVVKELNDTRRKQESQELLLRSMIQYICHQNNGQLPPELSMENTYNTTNIRHQKQTPSIFITSHQSPNTASNNNGRTDNNMLNIHDAPITPTSIGSRSPHTLNSYLPPSPGGSTMISEDDLDLPTSTNANVYHHRHQHQHQQQQQQQQHHQQHNHRRHLSTGAIPVGSTSLATSPVNYAHHHTLQPSLSSHSNEAFNFINPHDPLSH